MGRGPLKLFLSYAHEDRDLVTELRNHLAPLRHEQIVADWYDREVMAGQNWDQEIRDQLESSNLVIVVVSADFVASHYAYGTELALALRLHDQGRLRLLPVIGRNCKRQNLPLAGLQVLPEGAVPIGISVVAMPRRSGTCRHPTGAAHVGTSPLGGFLSRERNCG